METTRRMLAATISCRARCSRYSSRLYSAAPPSSCSAAAISPSSGGRLSWPCSSSRAAASMRLAVRTERGQGPMSRVRWAGTQAERSRPRSRHGWSAQRSEQALLSGECSCSGGGGAQGSGSPRSHCKSTWIDWASRLTSSW
eukprot:2367498-Prymnesium_polylepis.1